MSQTLTGVAVYSNTITAPAPGDFVTAASVAVGEQGLLNVEKYLYDHAALDTTARPGGNVGGFIFNAGIVVEIAIATDAIQLPSTGMGTIFLTGSTGLVRCETLRLPAAGTVAVELDGAAGLVSVRDGGGDVRVELNGPNATLTLTNSGATTTIEADGDTGRVSAGEFLAGSQPAGNADPGADDLLTGPNVPKAMFSVRFNGDTTVTMYEGGRYNTTSVVISGIATQANVTLARSFAAAEYAITGGVGDPANTTWKWGNKTANTFSLTFFNGTTGAAIDLETTILEFDCHVMGRQV